MHSTPAKPPACEHPAAGLHGKYQDVLRGPDGQVIQIRPVSSNAIVVDCRRILATLISGGAALGIQGMQFGSGLASWDGGGTPPATPAQTALSDPAAFTVPAADLAIDFVDDAGVVVAGPTNRLQIVATLGPALPPWPDANHASGSLREFGLVGDLGGTPSLINYVTHPVINKDPASTLERTLWLVF